MASIPPTVEPAVAPRRVRARAGAALLAASSGVLALATSLFTPSSASAQTWNNPVTGSWNLAGNWIGNVQPASSDVAVVTFNATAGQSYTSTQNLGTPFTLNTMVFNPAAAATINLVGS